ncbi:MAG: cytochrome b/b6 domain-containing protein, partial [Gammaproteobacteria bacterium]
MNWRNTAQRYGFLAQIFHWLVVILLVAQFSLIWYADDMPRGAEKAAVIGTHKALGITILAIIVLRVLWRFINPTPALPKDLDRRLGWVAHGTHWLLYALVLALPIVGWSMSSAGGHPVDYF